MFKLAFKEFKYNWFNLLGVILTLLLSGIFLATFSLLLINSIIAISMNSELDLKEPEKPIALFGTLIGIVFFLGLFALINSIKFSLNLRKKHYRLLRVLGFTHSRIRTYVFLESLIISLITSIISILVAVPIANLIIDFLQSNNVLEDKFVLFQKLKYQWIYILATIGLTILISLLSLIDIKNISITKNDEKKRFKKINKNFWKTSFGLVFLAGGFAIISIKPIMNLEMGQGMMFCGFLCYIIGLSFLMDWIVIGLSMIIKFLLPNVYLKMATKSLQSNIKTASFPIILLIVLCFFVNYSITSLHLGDPNYDTKVFIKLTTIIVTCFNGIIVINLLTQYFYDKKQLFKSLKRIGFSKTQIIVIFFIEYLLIILFAFMFALLFIIISNVMFIHFNHLQQTQWTLNFLISNLVIIASLLVLFIAFSSIFFRNQHARNPELYKRVW